MILFFTVPTSGTIRHEIVTFKDAARAYMKARGGSMLWLPAVDRPTMACRNRQVEEFLRTPADVFLSMDDDAIPTRDGQPDLEGLGYLLEALERDDVDVVFGWSLIHREDDGDLVPCIAYPKGSNPRRPDEWPIDFVRPHHADPLHDVTGQGVGSHCFAVKRHVFEAMRSAGRLYFEDVHERNPSSPKFGGRILGHDFAFCQLAADLGFRLAIDNRVFWGHRKSVDLRWVYELVRDLCLRIESHARVAEKAYPDLPAWITLRRAEEFARSRTVSVYMKNAVVPDSIGAPDCADVLIFEDVNSPAWRAWASKADAPMKSVERVGFGGAVVRCR